MTIKEDEERRLEMFRQQEEERKSREAEEKRKEQEEQRKREREERLKERERVAEERRKGRVHWSNHHSLHLFTILARFM